MTEEIKILLSILTAFALSMLVAPLVLKVTRKLKANQTILRYVDKHNGKVGTPTMGGVIFLFSMIITTVAFCWDWRSMGFVAMAVSCGFGLVGFLDDFLKIKKKENEGLKAYQKIVGQLGITLIVTIYAFRNPLISSTINLPFTDFQLDLQWWFVPCCLFLFIATTNSVNLTDGLDGLASNVSCIYFVAFAMIIFVGYRQAVDNGDVLLAKELLSLEYFVGATIGGLIAFIWYNATPAKIFMGDTGSLALGGGVACVAIFSRNPILILIIGIMFAVSCISVIMQVICYKITKKRIFLMAPLHHHLEYKGIKESKIVAYYSIITAVCGTIGLISAIV